MILLCKLVFNDQESNVHYYLFSHDHCSLTNEYRRLLFVIISIIVAQNQTLENHHHRDNRRRKFFLFPLLEFEQVVRMHPYGGCSHLHCLTMHTNTLIALEEEKKRRINWYPIELLNNETIISIQYWQFSFLSTWSIEIKVLVESNKLNAKRVIINL